MSHNTTRPPKTQSETKHNGNKKPASRSGGNDEALFNEMVDKVKKTASKEPMQGERYGNFVVTSEGVYYDPVDGESIWISSPIWPVAYLRDKDGKSHTLLIKVNDGEKEHKFAMPKRLIVKPSDLHDILLDLGQEIPLYPSTQKHLQTFLMTARPEKKMRCVDKAGWHGKQYVFPDGQVIGKNEGDEGVYPVNEVCPKGIEQKGTLKEWQETVFSLCLGNSRMLFSVGVAFASMCMQLVGEESGGFNLKGRSSRGKTRCLKIAISVLGSEDYKRSWKATANGLEGVCALHNDSMLPLDEFGQADENEVGEIVYMISSGVGKQRAARDGSPKDSRTWRVLLLSTGEVGLEDHMRPGKKKVKAGQLARIVDIPAEVGEHGCFEELHGCRDGKEFSDSIDTACKKAYGTVGREFIQRIIDGDTEVTRQALRHGIDDFVACHAKDCDGQVKRVAQRFGLVYAALLLANKLGMFGDKIDYEMISDAITQCYISWLNARGTSGDFETHNLIEHAKGVLNENAEGKFAPSTETIPDKKIRNTLWGYRNGTRFYVLPKAFNEQLCNGMDTREAAKILKDSGLLIPSNDKSSQLVRIPAHHKQPDRFYVFDLGQAEEQAQDA